MESLYLLIPLSAALVLGIIAVFGWALHAGQFDELEREGCRILENDAAVNDHAPDAVDPGQGHRASATEQST